MRRASVIGGGLILSLLLSPGVALAAPIAASTISISAAAHAVEFSTQVHGAKHCRWQSSPPIAGFAHRATCTNGKVVRVARIPANSAVAKRNFVVTLSVSGGSTRVVRWTVVQAGSPPRPSTTTTTAATGAPITRSPAGNLYHAGEFCPAVDLGYTIEGSDGPIKCVDDNGYDRWVNV